MGSVETDPDEFTVLVTGFAPFKDEYPQNPSWEIAKDLPAYLPARTAGKSDAVGDAEPPLPPVRIVVYPEPIRVNYQVVRELVPRLWDAQTPEGGSGSSSISGSAGGQWPPGFTPPARIDLLLHIGMAGPRVHYAAERVGRRDGYAIPDVDNEWLPDGAADHTDPAWIWYGVPPSLESDVDLDAALVRWRAGLASRHLDLRLSPDAGRYLCDFTYFSSLAHLFKKNKEARGRDARYRRRRVVFLHVPASAAPERIATGREAALGLIRALVATELDTRAQRRAAGIDEAAEAEAAVAAAEAAAAKTSAAPGADTVTGKWYRD